MHNVSQLILFPDRNHGNLGNMLKDIEQETAQSALQALERVTGISGSYTTTPSTWKDTQVDGEVRLSREGATHAFAAEVKGILRREHLASLVAGMRQLPQPSLLVARHVSEPQADMLIEQGVNYIDASGNVHIAHGAWFILVKGLPPPTTPGNRPRPLSSFVWKVVYALLRDPELGKAPIRTLADQAGVSAGTASKAIRALDERGWVSNLGRERVVVQPRVLWNAWETGWLDRLASNLFVTRAVAPSHRSIQDWLAWWRETAVDGVYIGGELGAQLLGTDIQAATATLHVRHWDASMLSSLRLVPAETGPFTVREVFGTLTGCPDAPGVAHPMLVRAELLSIPDERLDASREQLATRIAAELPIAP